MSYQALVNSQIKKAFNLLKDLAKDGTITKRSNQAFDFGSGEVATDSAVTTVVKVVNTETTKLSKDKLTVQKQVMLKVPEVVDLSIYDTLSFEGEVWKIGPVVHSNGFIFVVDIFKEAS